MPTHRKAALRDVMAAVYALLDVASLQAAAPGGVHHATAPEGETRDYVLLQSPSALPWDAMQSPGEEFSFQVAGVTLGADYGQALTLVGLAIELLDGERPTLDDHLVVSLRWRQTDTFREPDLVNGIPTWRAIAQFGGYIDQEAA